MDVLARRLADDLDGAFPEMVTRLAGSIYSGALQLTRDHHDAEDVTQETFLRAYRALRTWPPERIAEMELRGWTWTIALNLCRNRARRRPPPEPTAPAGDDPAVVATDRVALGAWRHRLALLPEAQRTAVVLRHVVGLPYREIADVTGRPLGTVKADVHRGLAHLRRIVDEEEGPS